MEFLQTAPPAAVPHGWIVLTLESPASAHPKPLTAAHLRHNSTELRQQAVLAAACFEVLAPVGNLSSRLSSLVRWTQQASSPESRLVLPASRQALVFLPCLRPSSVAPAHAPRRSSHPQFASEVMLLRFLLHASVSLATLQNLSRSRM